MKKNILIILLFPLLFGCKANYPVAQQSGKEDIAFLLFTSSKEYAGKTVQVSVNNEVNFDAVVVKTKKSNRRGTQYSISTGRKSVTVKCNGQILFSKQLFLSPQEVKIITLP